MADQARHDKGVQESRAIIVILNQCLGVATGEDGLFQGTMTKIFRNSALLLSLQRRPQEFSNVVGDDDILKIITLYKLRIKPRFDITHHGIRAMAMNNVCIVGQIARNKFGNRFL